VRPTAAVERRIAVSDTTIRLFEAGEGEPLLFLHGSGGVQSLLPCVDVLARDFRVVVPEHPGFGLSDFPEWLDGVDDLVFFHRELADLLGLETFHLAGLSLGGWVAAAFAVHYASRLRSLTLVDAAGLHVPEAPMRDTFGLGPEQLLRAVWFDPERALRLAAPPSPESTRIQVRNGIAAARLGWERWYDPKLRRRARWITAPTLVVWGAQDGLIPAAHAHAWVAAIPGARLAWIDRCGHVPPAERPEAFAGALLSFLRGLGA
jgi:pimeloyl-ACP methyl ester carboxylesterase